MEPDKSILLRPRFYRETPKTSETIIQEYQQLKTEVASDYSIKISGNHIWFYISPKNRKYFSPHLHLELEKSENGSTNVRGLFGPDQALWTMFMFFHFIVAGIFLIFGMIAYSNWTLKQPYGNDLLIMGLMVAVWILLYLIARSNRHNSVPQMHELEQLMDRVLG
ncbi:hypothetical protein FSS13T_02920 [Flavobacterium saliperosum S13]|uniref:GTP-binding protein n=2 Tax=Flavobacterium saliperosum TaxID=329186 RepID=A0A1G4V512_9FLAO|nr:hypothetical protein [Flavobacterium saliperosum]ESU27814.1 hypothetical protein FSS13T_02920 [Flavobacterium saliperosum S13]SCX01310.1 hypothetical protein SAMN02927925_00305 [Flavobacterium saliperosum]